MSEFLLSVGIDLGTTTTQVIFSRIEVENTASVTSVPRVKIVGKEIIYRSDIYFTPLLNRKTIDTPRVREIVEGEYKKAHIVPRDVSAGAVIITGETARKENSEAALSTLSGLAGDFVVATAGSDLESILAGRGAGTADMSKGLLNSVLVNLDIGGGTTNIAVFKNGVPVDTSCLDIGGRQIILDPRTLIPAYVAEKVKIFCGRAGLAIAEGKAAAMRDIEALCGRLAGIMAQSLGLVPRTEDLELFITAHPLRSAWEFRGLTCSGGVADFVYNDYDPRNPCPYGDIGAILGHAIRNCAALNRVEQMVPKETIRATVVGAGSNSMDISGSTIAWSESSVLPIQNIPIVKMTDEDEADGYRFFASRLAEKLTWYKDESGNYQQLAVGFKGVHNPSFEMLRDLAGKILEGMADYLTTGLMVIFIIDNDMAKSLGNLLMNALPRKKVIVLDNIKVENGDYIDIGVPVAQGRVIPVVVKTLIFGK
ncbi:MAG: ethanolamine ammonia-lyase reactivating factor EutA [Treponema sp.]|nr:ethanolamine ammonia-lyase reactivating factor EutA [Treponema sp.]